MQEAIDIMEGEPKHAGFMVHFEKVVDKFLHSGYFPDVRDGEEPIKTEQEAWVMAAQFASKTRGSYVNIYVVNRDFSPVDGYRAKMIENR